MSHAVTYAQILGHVIRGSRELRGISLETMATDMGFSSRSGWSRVESGDTTITAAQLRRAARCLRRETWAVVQDADNLAAQLTASGTTVLDNKPMDDGKSKKSRVVGTAAVLALVASAVAVANRQQQPPSPDDEGE
jgi:transcriptional regulator with XRE-family HTH domain